MVERVLCDYKRGIMRLFIDTDIGDDIDDALAIAMAVGAGADIVGVTTVYRDAGVRAAIAQKLLSLSGNSKVPVVPGASEPIKAPYYIGKLNYGADEKPISGDNGETAARFIADSAEKYGQDLTILAIGAETNIANAILRFPDKMKKAGKIVVMGGCFYCQHNEWNIVCDPGAARIVMQSGLNVLYVPWDVTRTAGIGEDNYARILGFSGGGQAGFVAELMRQWKTRNHYLPLLHDPLALYCCLFPERIGTCKLKATVLDDGDACGITFNLNDYDGFADKTRVREIEVLKKVDCEDVAREFMRFVYDGAFLSVDNAGNDYTIKQILR